VKKKTQETIHLRAYKSDVRLLDTPVKTLCGRRVPLRRCRETFGPSVSCKKCRAIHHTMTYGRER